MFQFAPLRPEDITPRALILAMMNSAASGELSTAEIVESAGVFGMEPTAVRVAAGRLVKDGILESPERGQYKIAHQAERFTRRVQAWHRVSDKTTHWTGDWIVILTQHLGRTDRKQLRIRERAFSLFGYREAETGVWVRPANLSKSLEDHRLELLGLGVDEAAMVLLVSEAHLAADKDWKHLWSAEALESYYQSAIKAMSDSLKRLDSLPPIEGARESLLIGQAVIRAINLDPLLPDELADNTLFLKMVDTMKTYNTAGRACWRAFREPS